jgi:cyanate permease
VQTLFLLVVAGTGGSVQHPVASSFVSREYEGRRRGSALGVLNFAGDLGKFIIPLVFALSLTAYGWRASPVGLGAVSFVFAMAFWYLLRDKDRGSRSAVRQAQTTPTKGWGILQPKTFGAILSMGVLDSSVRSALLTFVPFLLIDRGLSATQASLMLTVIFAGGAAGKLGCGILADKLDTTRLRLARHRARQAGPGIQIRRWRPHPALPPRQPVLGSHRPESAALCRIGGAGVCCRGHFDLEEIAFQHHGSVVNACGSYAR